MLRHAPWAPSPAIAPVLVSRGVTVMTPVYTRAEHAVDAVIHMVGLVAGLIGAVVLMWVVAQQDDALVYFACAVYALGLVAMLGFSAAYNLATRQPLKERLQRLDHAAIFVMIAGTYTPFALVKLGEPWGPTLFAVVWAITALGITLKLRFPRWYQRLGIGLYLLQGWVVLVALGPLADVLPTSGLILITLGGLLYTLGVLFHVSERLPFHNAIWHGLVLAAASCHFAVVMDEVALAAVAL